MPSYLDFDNTKNFRNFILGKTLTVPNGPQDFTADNYTLQKTRDMSNVDPGDVETIRPNELVKSQTSNVFKPIEYFVKEDFRTIPRKANLSLYPYFETEQQHGFISIMNGEDYTNESEMMKFAAWNIRENPQGPLFGRLSQNLYTATSGRVRILDALEGNTSTAINLITGREPLIEGNTKITVAKGLLGQGIDFMQTVAGVEFPWSEIPGDYLSNPRNPIIARPNATSEGGKFIQDLTGAIGSMIGITRRPTVTRKPSDLFLEYMGERQKSTLYDNLSYSKYGPDYTTSARSQNTSKIFAFTDKIGSSVNKLLGLEAPKLNAYIGDDRGVNVKDSMSDFNDRQVKSSYYLSLLFDEVQARVFQRTNIIAEGGGIGGNLTWLSSRSKNKLGEHNEEFAGESSLFEESLSTKYGFRTDSILGLTQEILETLPTEGGASRSHVANVIDQTSRVFREDGKMMSRGSAIKYTDKFTGIESGAEYCRVWTKDRSYMNFSDSMKQTTTSRKFDSSVYTNAWNLNIHPNSNGKDFGKTGSSNIKQLGTGDGFYAKKYMFSIENLAWKSSNTPGFTYNELPYCERGGNGGRIMWFPPYGLKVQEQNNANWEANDFLGRPEPVYTYKNTQRSGSISFKVIVDHPSILNLMVKDLFKNMPDDEADNYINAFFAGAQDVDFYSLIQQYNTLTESDVKKIQKYLDGNKDPETVKRYKTVIRPADELVTPKNGDTMRKYQTSVFFQNDFPTPGSTDFVTTTPYSKLNSDYKSYEDNYYNKLDDGLLSIQSGYVDPIYPGPQGYWSPEQRNDYKSLTKIDKESWPTTADFSTMTDKVNTDIADAFASLNTTYSELTTKLEEVKSGLVDKTVKNVYLRLFSSTSSPADSKYNLNLSYRRSYSVILDIVNKLAVGNNADQVMSKINLVTPSDQKTTKLENISPINLSEFGHESKGVFKIEYVENVGDEGSKGSGFKNIDCTDNYLIKDDDLKETAPNNFWCRGTSLTLDYEVGSADEPKEHPEKDIHELVGIREEPTVQTQPPIEEMKKIIMKTLSECYYFQQLEKESPLQFTSLKEKLKYFHPSFHSMTPEGLNSRLTFLHQCIRPGETLPIKGISDISDLNARNTTFGPPPICVMRIGDFYHSKIAIKDVNIEFDNDLWDLNPEGIGVQPMIANVTLQIYFIGGHGLSKPVEKLQNALSSNFYANTEMYDPKAISTETTIDGTDIEKYNKEFLAGLVENSKNKTNPTSQEPISTEEKISERAYIGTPNERPSGTPLTSLDYKENVSKLHSKTKNFYDAYVGQYNNIVTKYGATLGSMFLDPKYRTINTYTVQTGGGTQDIDMLGNYPKAVDFEVLRRNFKLKIVDSINYNNITTMFSFNKELIIEKQDKSEEMLKIYLQDRISDIVDEMGQKFDIDAVENKRNTVIKLLDKLNFIIETSHDGAVVSLKDNSYLGVTFSGYSGSDLYSKYSDVIDFIVDSEPLFYEDLDTTSYIFTGNNDLTSDNLSNFLSILLNSSSDKTKILNLYRNGSNFSDTLVDKLSKRLDNFMVERPANKSFRSIIKKKLKPRNDKPIKIDVVSTYDFLEPEKIKLKSVNKTSLNNTTDTLNYYRGKING